MVYEIVKVSFITHAALLVARVEGRFYRWSQPHRGIFLLFFVFLTLFSISEFLIDTISPISGYSGIREFGIDVDRLSEVFGVRERMFLILMCTVVQRFCELYNNSWMHLFIQEEWLRFTIVFAMFCVFVNAIWLILWIVDLYLF